MPQQQLPSEQRLHALARRFADTEKRVRALIAQAPDGDRAALLRQALLTYSELRQASAEHAAQDTQGAYLIAALAVIALLGHTGAPVPDPTAALDLAGSLARQLDTAVRTAQEHARAAFRTVTADNVDDAAHEATTALVDAAGRRRTLGAHAEMLTSTIGRHATTRGTFDALGDPQALVRISGGGGRDPLCARFAGNTYPADHAPRPPFHPGCTHVATPAGFSYSEHFQAMRKAAYRDFYAARHAAA